MKITYEDLVNLGACSIAERLRVLWPEGMEVTPVNIRRAARVGLDYRWFIETLGPELNKLWLEYIATFKARLDEERERIEMQERAACIEALPNFARIYEQLIADELLIRSTLQRESDSPPADPNLNTAPAGGLISHGGALTAPDDGAVATAPAAPTPVPLDYLTTTEWMRERFEELNRVVRAYFGPPRVMEYTMPGPGEPLSFQWTLWL